MSTYKLYTLIICLLVNINSNNRGLNLTVKYVTFNHYNMSSNLIALINFTIYAISTNVRYKNNAQCLDTTSKKIFLFIFTI